jgi:ketosteroid isomerase-like protein
MSNENIEIVKRCYQAFGRGDLEAVMACISDDLTRFGAITSPKTAVPWYLSLTCKSEVPRFFEALNSAVEHTKMEPFAFAAAGDYVYASLKLEQKIRKNDRRIAHEVVHRIRFQGGKVVEWWALEDTFTIDAAFRS